MKRSKHAVGVLVTAMAAALIPAAPGIADFGDLDNSFGTGGTTTVPGVQFLGGVLRVSDDRILALGETDGTGDFAVEMLRSDGTPDPNFGSAGLASTDFAGGEDYANAAVELPNGDFLVVGGAQNGSGDYDIALAEYTSTGDPEAGFSGDGKLLTDPHGFDDQAIGVGVLPNGKIMVGLEIGTATTYVYGVARYTASGALDPTFGGSNGIVTKNVGTNAAARTFVLRPDGSSVVGGGTNLYADAALAGFTASGKVDSGFGKHGRVTADFGGTDEVVYGLVARSDGSLIATGQGGSGPNTKIVVAEFHRNGTPNTAFNGTGHMTLDPGTNGDRANGLAVQPDGKIVVAGRSVNPADTSQAYWVVGRVLANGKPDPAFGTGGTVLSNISAGFAEAGGVAVQSGGRIVLAGTTGSGGIVAGYVGDHGPGCTQVGTPGRDTVVGSKIPDVLCGFGGNDTITGLGADDLFLGGPGSDTASFARSKAAVTVNLGAGTATGEGSDTLVSIERATGSDKGDELRGSTGPNVLSGGGGPDVLLGLAGKDRLLGGGGNDTLNGGPGTDTCLQGAGTGPRISCEH